MTDTGDGRSPWTFFLLVVVLSGPFLVLGAIAEMPEAIPINLPASAFMFVCPLIAASILTYLKRGADGVRRLLMRAGDFRKIDDRRWYLPMVLLMPAVLAMEYWVMTLLAMPVPDPEISVLLVPVFFTAFLVPALCEEMGWQGYACDPLQARWGALGAGLIIGAIWGTWHAVPYLQAGNSPAWAFWQIVASVLVRVLVVWVYNNTGGSVFSAIVFHAMTNVSEFLYPVFGSAYDPLLAAVILTVVVAPVVFLWGPTTLARYRYGGGGSAASPAEVAGRRRSG
jgi:membrane protease YdiL (CAAX protease family)